MTQENALVPQSEIVDLVKSAFGMIEFDISQGSVNWAETREVIDPRGTNIKAQDLIDQTFLIKKIKPVHSSLGDGSGHFYFIVGVDQDGQLFNTALGGQAVVEELDQMMWLNYELYQAQNEDNEKEMRRLHDLGAGAPFEITLRQKQGGRFGRYYVLD